MGRPIADEAAALLLERFGVAPSTVVEAPGRVNLIGEHTDYSLLPVLPCAIDRSVAVAAAPGRPGRVRAVSSAVDGEVDLDLDAGIVPGGWGRYVAAAVRAAGSPSGGVVLAVASDLPPDGGLSSSSALTVALVSALSGMAGRDREAAALVAAASAAERSVGIEGGTMDQEVIVRGVEGTALRIDFLPPRFTPIRVPDDIRIVIAHSGERSAKSGAIRDAYDLRVIGCRLAAVLLGDRSPDPRLGRMMPAPIDDLPDVSTPAAVAAITGVPVDSLVALSSRSVAADTPAPVAACARHVFSEAAWVDLADRALRESDGKELGALLDQSHRSLQGLGVSSPGLDRVVEALRSGGAHGARLTGAGFGGYAVAVTSPDRLESIIGAALAVGDGPAFEVRPSRGLS